MLNLRSPPPLSYYPHSKSREVLETVYTSIKGGNAVGNDVILNFGVHDLPFGGVGDSGLGNYHGKFGFDSMTRPLAVMTVRTPEIIASLRYPVNCYNPKSTVHKIVRWLTKPSAPTLFSRAARKSIKLLQAWSGGLFMLLIGLLIGSQIPK